MAYDDETIAAPPDDGGHLGNFSRPEDELTMRDPSSQNRSPENVSPPLHVDPTHSGGSTLQRDESGGRNLDWRIGLSMILALWGIAVWVISELAQGY